MHCIILLPDAAGRLPTAKELRQRGFAVSRAAWLPEPCLGGEGALADPPPAAETALAAETPAPYGQRPCPES